MEKKRVSSEIQNKNDLFNPFSVQLTESCFSLFNREKQFKPPQSTFEFLNFNSRCIAIEPMVMMASI